MKSMALTAPSERLKTRVNLNSGNNYDTQHSTAAVLVIFSLIFQTFVYKTTFSNHQVKRALRIATLIPTHQNL